MMIGKSSCNFNNILITCDLTCGFIEFSDKERKMSPRRRSMDNKNNGKDNHPPTYSLIYISAC